MLENFRLRVFRTVARQPNFSRAADELFLTQPAITQQMKSLEEEIGTPLFKAEETKFDHAGMKSIFARN